MSAQAIQSSRLMSATRLVLASHTCLVNGTDDSPPRVHSVAHSTHHNGGCKAPCKGNMSAWLKWWAAFTHCKHHETPASFCLATPWNIPLPLHQCETVPVIS